MAYRHRDGHRVGLYRQRGGRHGADCLEAGRRVPHRDPHAAHRPARHRYVRDEADDLRVAAVLVPADVDPADGPPAWESTWALPLAALPLPEFPLRSFPSSPFLVPELPVPLLPALPGLAQASPPLRSLAIPHHQTFSSSFTLPLTISPILAPLCRRGATLR